MLLAVYMLESHSFDWNCRA